MWLLVATSRGFLFFSGGEGERERGKGRSQGRRIIQLGDKKREREGREEKRREEKGEREGEEGKEE